MTSKASAQRTVGHDVFLEDDELVCGASVRHDVKAENSLPPPSARVVRYVRVLGSAVELASLRMAATSFWHSSARPSGNVVVGEGFGEE